jgi:DNA repair photolyase
MAIISASRRTDIPAFFSEWFMKRVRAGFFYRINPFNAHQVTSSSLKPGDVDAIVFWTKNPQPLLRFLPELDDRGFNYYFQFTLNPYDTRLEPHVPPLAERLHTFRTLADMVGARRVIWRYDPIILSSITPGNYHREQFARIAEGLQGFTERVMFSFLDFYGKASGRLKTIEREQGITFFDITAGKYTIERRELLAAMQKRARDNGMNLWSCAETEDLEDIGIRHGHCIDGKLVHELFGAANRYKKDRYQRRECGCVESVDMGIYNTCSFQCAYCYANTSHKMIAANLLKHCRTSPALIGEYSQEQLPAKQETLSAGKCQQSLF